MLEMAKVQILVIDDEPAIRKLLERGLTGYGYQVATMSNGEEALQITSQERADIILLDINLETNPDGLEVCQIFRERSKIPIIMLTVRDEKQMKLAALNAGADDYVTKPFDMEELEARIRSVLRRSAYEGSNSSSGEIHVHDLTIDLVKRRVMLNDNEIHLTPKEYDLLKLLATNPGKVLTFGMLLQEVWGQFESVQPEHNVRVYVNTLRKKIKDDPATRLTPRYIFNEPGIGYRFTDFV
jgi:two-component system KDP operon response regulator KdpE